MRTITAATAFKIPSNGINLPPCEFQVSPSVFRNTEKLSCANVSERKQAIIYLNNKGLLLPDRSLSGRKFHIFSDFQYTDSLCLEELYQFDFTAAKSSNGLSRLFVFI